MKEDSNLFNKEKTLKITFPYTVTNESVNKLVKTQDINNVPFGMYL